MKQVNCITINTDASFSYEHQVGGYAFYIVCDIFKIQKGGTFKKQPKNAQEAEMMCIGNAFATLLAQKELPKCRWLIVNNDCKYGMEDIRIQKTALGKSIFKMRQLLINRLHSPKSKFRHVKAHNGTPDARSWVNDWCDKEAKKWMRKSLPDKKEEILTESNNETHSTIPI